MKYYFLITISFIFFNLQSYAQHEADFWYFGNYAGLDFSSGNPEPLTDGQLKNYEGCATISDSTGNLLFYTNGVTVWNKEHQIMENGDGLLGDTSSTQSAIVIPLPENDSLFFVFTTDELTSSSDGTYITDGLRYSIVNMNKEDGKGKIITKNILLLDSSLEKITAVKHYNNKNYWLIVHEWGNDAYYSYLIDNNGINPPIISNIGTIYENDQRMSIGYMKASPDGTKIATAILNQSIWEIFDFDNQKGVFSNPIEISSMIFNIAYGCEFSPDASKLYISEIDSLFQLDMNAGTQSDIQNSKTKIAVLNSPVGAIQNAINGKLYVTNDTSEYLSVINFPDSLPATCSFEQDAIYLDGRKSRLGLPNFIQSYFIKPDFKVKNTCLYDETQFIINGITDIDSVAWNFDDTSSGSLNISKEISPTHIYTTAGIYKVNLTVWYNNISYNYSENIKIIPLPELNLANDTTLCIANNYIIDAYTPHLSYLWNDMSTDSVLHVNTNGKYWTNIENTYTGCKNSDTINIIFSEIPEINIGNDTSFCENTTFLIDAFNEGYLYIWQDNSTEASFIADVAGSYHVTFTNEDGCENSDSISLSIKNIPRFYFPADTVICENWSFFLTTKLENDVEYVWQDQSADSYFLVNGEGFYKLVTNNICGTWSDSLNVTTKYCGTVLIPNVFTPTNDGINELFKIKGIDEDVWDLRIYSRWGELVYHSADYQNDWDGENLTPAVYYYILSNIKLNEQYKSTVRIIRAK